MDQLILNDIKSIEKLIMPTKKRIKKHSVCDEYVVFVNRTSTAKYFACALMSMAIKVDSIRVHVVITDSIAEEFIIDFQNEIKANDEINESNPCERIFIYSNIDDYLKKTEYKYEKIRFCTFVDASDSLFDSLDEQKLYLNLLQQILNHMEEQPTAKMVHTEIIPEIEPLPGGLTGLAEREYEVYCSQFSSNSKEQFILKCEEIIRSAAKAGMKIVVSRMQNVYGPLVENKIVSAIKKQIVDDNKIVLDGRKNNRFIDMNYIVFATAQVHYMFVKGKGGNIYNLAQFRISMYELITKVYPYLAPSGTSLLFNGVEDNSSYHQLLCCKKAQPLLGSNYAKGSLVKTFYKSIIADMSLGYSVFDYKDSFKYDGKLDLIKEIELEMAMEIKRICEKYNIKYFLVGGSLLGAVRHQGFIPWDDDLDIGMLREDYDKFRKVAPLELDSKYYYQSYTSGDNSHYIFDKIRLKDTFFSTKFSDRFSIENGLFVDILVYDKTAKKKKAQQRHIKALCIWSRAINVRWVNYPRKNIHYKLTKTLLPIMRLVPFEMYHQVFEKILTRYNRSKSEWLIDGVGQNIRKGAFPAYWFDETIEVPFENVTLPIPKEYDAYLQHWYGKKYMELPPVSERNSGHTMKRIDLGAYIQRFGFNESKYHHASLQGELYDYYEEEK